MTNDVMGIINLSENEEKIGGLAVHRPIAGIPFGARYRIIDFMISNMVNSGIQKVAVFTRNKFRSLQDHLGSGKYWNLDRKRDGLYMIHPVCKTENAIRRFGDLETFKDNIDFFQHSRHEYVLLTRSYAILNMDFSEAIKEHKESGADITIVGKSIADGDEGSSYIGLNTLQLDDDGRVKAVSLNFGSLSAYNLSLEIYIMKRELLIDIILNAYQNSVHAYLKQALLANLPNLNVRMYDYAGNVSFVNSITNYFRANMELLNRNKFDELFDGGKIYTKIKDEPPTKYSKSSQTKNAIVANGCIIEGTVENSILFRGVHVKKGAVVRNSVIMQDTTIGENAKVNYIIADKGVRISDNKLLMGDGGIPYVIKKAENVK